METFWQSGWDFITNHLYFAKWYVLCFDGLLVVAFFTALGWYFSFMRGIAGVVFVAIAAALFGYREGQIDAQKHDTKPDAKPTPKVAPPEPQPDRWLWPWEQK